MNEVPPGDETTGERKIWRSGAYGVREKKGRAALGKTLSLPGTFAPPRVRSRSAPKRGHEKKKKNRALLKMARHRVHVHVENSSWSAFRSPTISRRGVHLGCQVQGRSLFEGKSFCGRDSSLSPRQREKGSRRKSCIITYSRIVMNNLPFRASAYFATRYLSPKVWEEGTRIWARKRSLCFA